MARGQNVFRLAQCGIRIVNGAALCHDRRDMVALRTLDTDVLIVGSGINSLVCAALLARSGRSVCVIEREAVLGGCIRTEELTLPGFRHDTLSAAHSLFVAGPAYAALGPALHAAGLEYRNSESPTGVLLPDGRHLVLTTSRATNIERFEREAHGDGAAYAAAMDEVQENAEVVFTLLGSELWSGGSGKALLKQVWKRGAHPFAGFLGASLTSCRAWLDGAVRSDTLRALLAPWVLHTGLGPDSPLSGLMAKVVAFTLESVGMPLVYGGNANTVAAFRSVIEAAGGELRTGSDVVRVLVEDGVARGVELADGGRLHAREVICNVTPTQLYGRLLAAADVPEAVAGQTRAWRYGKGNMQIHLALSQPPRWPAAELSEVVYLHLSAGPEAVSRAVNEAERGMLPAEPTICVSQPSAIDDSRAPSGQCVLWIQVPECPRRVGGDASGLIDTPADGAWTEALRETYADRVLGRIAQHAPNLLDGILARRVLSPSDLERINMNLVGGDPYGGDCAIDQSFLWRPLRATRNHATPIRHLWHIGASTHPGPGLGGISGLHVARRLGAR